MLRKNECLKKRYRVERVIGQGGSSIVYDVYDEVLKHFNIEDTIPLIVIGDNKIINYSKKTDRIIIEVIEEQIALLGGNEQERNRRLELLKYQIDELEKANIKIGEIKELKEKLSVANSYEKTFSALSATDSLLSGTDDTDGVITNLNNAIKFLKSIQNNSFDSCLLKLEEALTNVQDARSDVDDYLSNPDYLEIDADKINQRLDFLSRLMVKYGSTEEEMLDFLTVRLIFWKYWSFLKNHLPAFDGATDRFVLHEILTGHSPA